MKNAIGFLKVLFLELSMIMVGIVITTSLHRNLLEALPCLNKEAWFTATIIDFYFNIAIISFWVIYKENNWVRSCVWIVLFVALGSIATAFYVFWQLLSLKEGEPLEKVFLRR